MAVKCGKASGTLTVQEGHAVVEIDGTGSVIPVAEFAVYAGCAMASLPLRPREVRVFTATASRVFSLRFASVACHLIGCSSCLPVLINKRALASKLCVQRNDTVTAHLPDLRRLGEPSRDRMSIVSVQC